MTERMATAEQNDAYNEVFEEAADERQEQTIHHIRANSSIMQLKKILGKNQLETQTSNWLENSADRVLVNHSCQPWRNS